MIRRRLSSERGMTLIEVLVAMTIGLVVLMAAFMLLDRTFVASGQVADRTEALQRGRQAMSLITRQLRSGVCIGTTSPPVAVGSNASSVTFFADLSDGSVNAKKRTLTWDSTASTLTESVTDGVGTYPDLTFTGTPLTSTLLTKVDRIPDTSGPRDMFRYFQYQNGTTDGTLQQMGVPLTSTTVTRVAVIKVGFRVYPDRPLSEDRNSAVLEDDVVSRVSDPTKPEAGARCV
jgi:prepilin-type N-terminal cleavage/methylation domain-containing protein